MIFALAAYIILQFAIALWASRFVNSEADYFVAGRRFGLLMVGVSVFATWFGAETVMGASGAIAEEGLAGGRADPFGYTICLIGMALFLAYKLRDAGVMTFPDFFEQRFGARAEVTAAILTIPTSIIWASAQLLAMGQIISETAAISLNIALFGGAVIIIAYTTIGGLLGDAMTDMVQGAVMMVGLTILLITILVSGDFSFGQITPEQFDLFTYDEEGTRESWLSALDTWMVPILGSLVAQEAISRFLGAKTASIARKGCFLAAGLYLVFGSIPLMIGLLGHSAGFEAGSTDSYLPELAKQYLSPVMYILLMGAIISAILSTVDTTLLAVSAIAQRNLIDPIARDLPEPRKLMLGRSLTLLAGLMAYAIAASGETIKGLVEIASSFGSAGIVVALLIGLHSGYGREKAALAALFAGAVLSFLGYGMPAWFVGLFDEAAAETMPLWTQGFEGSFVISVLAALGAYIGVAELEKRGIVTGGQKESPAAS
ncbi:MAG TPA: sodium:solute symporter family protein [Hyphomonas sp.]|nr:sodium:solute symporter [Hyphomonas sp.]HRJ02350.1 sodium:solute symporter family protein [Hyphomonas sp.]